MTKEIKQNVLTYLVFVFIAIVGIAYGKTLVGHYQFLRRWDFQNILLLSLGIPFLLFQAKAALPDFWQNNISNKNRFLVPVLIGVVFGIFDIIVFKIILHPQPYTELPPSFQPFPYSIFLYFSGAFEVEIFYRLIPFTLILLLGKWYKNGKYFKSFFWAGAILTALREPLEQLPADGWLLILYSFVSGFLMNFLQAVWYKKAGFLASLSIRIGHYLCWHILLGIYIEHFELIK
jgi:hypothetical protein